MFIEKKALMLISAFLAITQKNNLNLSSSSRSLIMKSKNKKKI
jgi:hypothetical protein